MSVIAIFIKKLLVNISSALQIEEKLQLEKFRRLFSILINVKEKGEI